MATVRWQGGASAVAQVRSYAFGGTWEADDVIRVTIGSKVYDFTSGSTVTATVVSNLVTSYNALSSTDYPEFAEMTASASTTTFKLTADTAGKEFTATLTPLEANLSAADAQTIEGAGVATTGTATTASAGPNDWSTAKNWSAGAVPVDGDDVIIDKGEFSILYGLSQTSIDLASLKILVTDNDSWQLGLPEVNEDGTSYFEYRTTYLTLGTATTVELRTTAGPVRLNTGSNQATVNVYETGSENTDGTEALLWKGAHTSNVLTVHGAASVGVCVLGGETATLATLSVGSGATVRCGSGLTVATVENLGGTLRLNSAVTSGLTQTGGTTTVDGTGAVAALDLSGGTVEYNTTGALGDDSEVSDTGVLTFNGDLRTKTTNAVGIDLYGRSAQILDSNGVATGGSDLTVNFFEGATSAQVDWGRRDLALTRTTVP